MRVVTLAVVLTTVYFNFADCRATEARAVDCTGVADGTFIYDTCASFVVCYGGEGIAQNCDRGSYFDETEDSCLPDTAGTCPENAVECTVDGEFSANPSNCSTFYVCYEGELVEQSCGSGSYFDAANSSCAPDVDNTCWSLECTENGAFSASPTNCSMFYVCYDGKLVEQSCGSGSYFDTSNLYCIPDVNNTCWVGECTEDGALSASPANCSTFYVCYEGELVEQSCGSGSYFDAANSSCAPDVDNACWSLECTENGAFSASPTNCSMFYVCYDGKLVEQSCGSGSYFDTSNLYCIPDVNNTCWVGECTEDGALSASPANCSTFYVCYEGELVEQSCGSGSYFDAANSSCAPDVDNTCWSLECTENGAFSASPTNCSMFYVCYDGKLVEQSCGSGSYFDTSNLYCIPDVNNTCWVGECTEDGALSASPANCSTFYVCYEGELVEQSCGSGSYFDAANSSCAPDVDNTCWSLECTENGAFSASPTNCSMFYVCYDGKLVEQSCGSGSYFDTSNLYCIPDVNNTCWVGECTEDGALSASPANCSTFYVCYEGELVEQSCGSGSYFDAANSSCAPDVDNTCWSLECTENGAFSASPTNCSMFYVCYDGKLVEQSCGTGSYFDSANLYCLPDVDNVCWTVEPTGPAPCQCPGGYGEGEFVENPDTCYLYSICSGGQLVEQSCGVGNYFNGSSKTCEKDVNNACWPQETTTTEAPASCSCPGGYADGEFVANPDTCYLYSICSEGQLHEHSCGVGNYFNASSKKCEEDENNACWPQETTTAEAPASCSCPGGYADGEFVANPDTCYLYSICSEGQLHEHSCGVGNYFNASSKKCEEDENNACWPQETTTTEAPASCSCPGGYADGEFVANPDTCYLYSICSEGQLHEQSCGVGNYFNASSKKCEEDENNACWPQETTTAEAPASCSCPGGYGDGEFVANPDTCYLYSICSEGQLHEHSCGVGNYFNASSKKCEEDENNACWPQETTTTEAPASCSCPGGYADGEFVANPDTCYLYSICSEGQLHEQSCGVGNYFNASSKKCEEDENNACWPQETTTAEAPASCSCPGGYADGEFVANPDTCYLYSICSEGQLHEQSCGVGNYFNASSKKCEEDENNACWPQETTTAEAPASCSCPGGYADGEFVANPDTCYLYSICSEGQLHEHSCGVGNYFNASSKKCEEDENNACWPQETTTTEAPASCSCPGGYADGEFVANPDTCYLYSICSEGQLHEQSCGVGNYFNASSKKCEEDENNACWPQETTTTEAPASCSCPGGYADGEFVANPDTCYLYSICSEGQLHEHSCDAGSCFNADTKTCEKGENNARWAEEITKTVSPASSSCPGGLADGDLIESEDSCDGFYICFDGELIAESCGKGNYFDRTHKTCVRDNEDFCWQSSTIAMSTSSEIQSTASTISSFEDRYSCPDAHEDGDVFPYPGDCSKFYICMDRALIEVSCDYGNYFDNGLKSCVLDTSETCWRTSTSSPKITHSVATESTAMKPASAGHLSSIDAATPCPDGYQDGDFASHSNNCSMFFICDNGKLIEKACGYGSYFDTVSRNCLLDTFGICWQLAQIQSTTEEAISAKQTSISTADAPHSCPQGYDNGEFKAYPKNCFMFYFCFDGELIEGSCGYGNYFDNSSNSCVLDTLGVCWPLQSPLARSATFSAKKSTVKRPVFTPSRAAHRPCRGGELDGDFIPYPNNCSMFYVCYNGKSFEESCGYGNYFDNHSKSCILDVLGVCWQPINSPTISPSTTTKRLSSTTRPTTKESILGGSNSTPSANTSHSCAGGFEYGEFVPYPNNCSMFFICYNGKLAEESCGYGNYFDKFTKSCVLDTFGVCWQVPIAPTTASTPLTTPFTTRRRAPSTSPTAISSSPRKTSTTSTTLAQSTTTPSTTIALSTTTASNTVPLLTTTASKSDENPYSCLNGHNDGQLFAYPNNCSMFYFCYKGMLIVESCGYNNYFDHPAKRCVFDTTRVCWHTLTSSATNGESSVSSLSTAAPSTAAPTTTAQSSPIATQSVVTQPIKVLSESGSSACSGGYADGEFIPHPSSCYQFLVCYRGEAIEMSCGLDKYFDEATTSCVPDKMGICWPKNNSASTIPTTPSVATSTTEATHGCLGGYSDGELVPVPGMCHLFFVCYHNELTTLSCGDGNYFDKSRKGCAPDTRRECWKETVIDTPTTTASAAELCSNGMREGQIASHQESCHAYQICHHGELVKRSCGLFNYFNPSSNECEWDYETKCWPTQTTVLTEKKKECPNGLMDGQFIASPSSCFLYQICSNGELVEGNCGTFNYFNPLTNHCERDLGGVCWPIQATALTATKKECPNGLKDGQFSASPSSCLLYQICSNGELVEGNCGTFNYFNPLTNHCERDLGGVCWPIQATALTATKKECPNGLKDGQFIASPSSCFLYQICSNGELVEGNCGTFNYFNPLTNHCERDLSGSCWPTKPTALTEDKKECPNGLKDGQFIASPSSCLLYQICSNGELVEGNCGTFNYFNPLTNHCERDLGGVCWPIQATALTATKKECPNGLKDGQFSASPSSCLLYQICSNGELVEGNCGTFNYFNPLTNHCERDLGGVCWPIQPTALPATKKECPNGLKDGQFIASPSSCLLYQICSNGELVEGNCGTFNYFNPLTNHCERDLGGVCWPIQATALTATKKECPNGLKDGQFSASPSSCLLYQICSNGELVEGNCGTFNYFNPLTNHCERDLGGVCWPIQATALTATKKECPNGLKDGQFSASPSSCLLYQICSNGELVEGNCGTFNYFNPLTNHCERDLGGVCWPIQATALTATKKECPNGLKDGQFIASPSSCLLYQICSNGELVEGNCGTFNYFNPLTNHCERDLGGVCWPIQATALTATKKECPNGLKDGQFSASPSSCLLYQICSNGELVEGNCGTFNYFNPLTNHCERDLGGVCWPIQATALTATKKECPNGLKDGQFIASPSSCFLYQICSNGELVEGNCGTFNYFNPLTNHCERDLGGVCWPIQATALTATKKECPNGLKDGQFIASPSSCFRYQICSNGELVEGNCGVSNYFNTNTNLCERDDKGVCWPVQSTTSAKPSPTEPTQDFCSNGQLNGQLSGHDSSCSAYFICAAGELVEGNCGVGNFFNTNSNLCEPDSNANCWPLTPETTTEVPVCPYGLLEGQFMSHSNSCSRYYICSGGELVEGNCGFGNLFDKNENICERDTTGQCWPTNSSPPPRPTPPAKPTSKDCPRGTVNGQFLANPSSCHLYYICSNGQLVDSDCGSGNIFNTTTLICESDIFGVCWPTQSKPCPVGILNGQFIANPSSCQQYQICNNGQLLNGDCGPGKFFNRTSQLCELDVLGICDPSNAVPTSPTSSNSKPCPIGVLNGQFIANPSSCHQYQICNNGQLLNGDCGPGKFFNRTSQLCELDVLGICDPSNAVPTSPTPSNFKPCPIGVLNGQFIANPSSCQQYQICNNGQLLNGDCGPGKFFNKTSQLCELDVLGICDPSNAVPTSPTPPNSKPCPIGVLNGQFIANPSSCHQYQICNNGQLLNGDCGPGKFFNRTSQLCELDVLGICDPSNAVPTSSTPPNSKPCPIGVLNGQFIANPSSCHQYQICNNGQLLNGDCGPGKFFNRTSQLCELDVLGICDPSNAVPTSSTPPNSKPCPIGVLNGQFIANPSSCHQYQICNNGQLLNGDCGPGKFFNRTSQLCELDVLGICDPSNAVPTSPTPSNSKPCPIGVLNGQFIANPSSCQQYQICNNGQLLNGDCGPGKFFNRTSQLCELDVLGICDPSNAVPTSPTSSNSKPCPIGVLNGQFIANPSSCQQYQICNNGQLLNGDCGPGKFFNRTSQLCELDVLGICDPSNAVPTSPTPSNSKPCPIGVLNGQFIANPSSCQQYQICNNGQLLNGDCGPGKFFNRTSQLCELDVLGICDPLNAVPTSPTPSNSKPCPIGVLNGQFIANPSSCQQYQICNNGQLLNGDCGPGKFFNRTSQLCELDVLGICDPSNAVPTSPTPPNSKPCPIGVLNGQFIANPSSCQQYQICNNGQLLNGDCGPGKFFNRTSQLCELDVLGICDPSNAVPTSPTPPNSKPCPIGVLNGQFIANPSSCHQYQICNNGQLLNGDCGPGKFFNRTSQLCELDVFGVCDSSNAASCSNGLQSGQFIANPSSCHKYHICYNGKLLDGDCGAGKLFNKNTLLCEPDVFGICNPININACPTGVANGQFVPIPGECDKFWICNGGSLIEQSCGVGYYYDVDYKYCTRDVDGSCWTAQTSSDTCIGVADGTFLPNDAACNKFFMCYNNTKISQECGVGNVFNSATLSCVRDSLGTCWKKVTNVCAKQPTGSFVPNPANCQEFYVCYSNRAVLQQCGNGNYFNSLLAVCEPDLNGLCVNVCQGLRGNVSLPHSNCDQFYTCSDGLTTGVGTCPTGTNFDALAHICLNTAVCEANLCSNSANGVVYPVQNDVSSFYSCYNHIALKMTCPEGTAFDSLLSICIPDTGRCVGRKNGFTVASPNNPNAYYVCKSNMAIFEQCPSYAIFDEKKGVCVQAQRKRFVRNICSGEPDGSLLPGDACNVYYLCLDGEVVEQNCGAYSAFSVKLGHCVFNLSCFDRNEICAKASDIETFSDARRQTAYIKCRKGVAKSEKCQKHLMYSHDIGYCVPREMAMSEEELVELCEDNADNSMAPALDCRKFYMCRNKVAILQQCAVDQYFDVKTGSCRPDVDRKCWQRSETLRRSFFLKSVCLDDQMRVNPDDCTRYEVCTFGMWLQKSCPRKQVFDANSQSCIPGDADKVCPRARSAPVLECSHDMSLRPSDEACTDYYRCADNQWELKRCPVGEFFNPLTATCSRDVSACARVHVTLPAKDSRCVSNETIASDTNCGLFYICYEGEWWYRHCAEGTYFNKSLDGCTPNDGTCRLTSEKGSCKNGTAKPSDFNPCSAYHLCVDGSWTVQYCPPGHHFKESRKACMQDHEEGTCRSGVRIPSSTCVDGQRNHQTSNCFAFDLCSFGKWYSVPCPQGSYFDISLRRCIENRGDCSADGALRRDCIEGTSRPSQYNCTEFYFCTKGKWYVESCLRGFQYNATIDKCIQTNATCPVRAQMNWPQDKCADAEAVSSEPHESNCTMYYLCVHGLAVEADCALGQFYDEKSKRCRLNNGSCRQASPSSDGVCKEKANGSLLQNPSNCTTYYTCLDAVAVLSYCPVGEYFNTAAGTCQTDTGMCNKVQLCDSSTGDYVPHEVFCNIYYSCVRGLALPVACDAGQLFDPHTKKCTTDVYNRCVDGILVGDAVCLGGEDIQPKEDTEDCSAYIMCSQGTAQRLQCPKGQFFNSIALACVLNDGSCAKASVLTETMSCNGRHGYLMPDPEHCNAFYVCINGALQYDRCVDGEYFDASTSRCTPMASNQTCAPVAGLLSALCATSEDDTNFADPSDCRKYFQCNNAEVQSKKCRTGESFDTLLGFCRQNDGTCLLENGQRVGACAGKHGKLAVDADNCRGYFTCINGQKIPGECEIGEFFDKSTKCCTKDPNNTCKGPENELLEQTQLSCSGLTELVFYPNVNDGCQTFYQCAKGTPRIHKCPEDLLFNGVTGTCDWKDYVKCIDMTDPQHSDELCMNAKNGTRYGSTIDNCDSYFVCTNGKLNSFRCDNGLKFNTNLDKCDNAANVNCTMAPQI